jgi:ribosomal protein S18
MSKTLQEKKIIDKNIVKEVSFVEKELLLNSLTQQELLKTTKDLNKTIKELTKTLKILEGHEYLTIHKNKWKLIGYNISLGILFAIGTVLGLVLLSWLTFNFFKDSTLLNQIVQNQLKIRQLDVTDIRERIKNDLSKTIQTSSGTKTGSGQK